MTRTSFGAGVPHLRGHCAPGLEGVADAFARNFEQGIELGAGFAVVRGGEVLVDLTGGFADAACERRWCEDTLVAIYSSTKGVAALEFAALAAAGQLDFAARVTDYWPEFGAAGKAEVTVAQMLSHQAGLAGLRDPVTVEDLIEHDGLARRMAAAEPLWPAGTAVGYHPLLWGTLAQELCLRITGETLGTRLARRAPALGSEVYLGLPDVAHGRCADIQGPNRPWRQRPGVTDAEPPLRTPSAFDALVNTNPVLRPFKDVCSAPYRRAELPAANGHATALGLARLYCDAIDRGGAGLDAARVQVVGPEAPDLVLTDRRFRRSAAGFMLNHDGIYGPDAQAFGHDGAGGSFGYADPGNQLGVGYVMNQMQVHPLADRRGRALLDALYSALPVA